MRDAALTDELTAITAHVNDDHADTVALIGRYLIGVRHGGASTVDARVGALDDCGIEFAIVVDGDQVQPIRHDFALSLTKVDDARSELLGLLNAARRWIGPDVPLTSLERELAAGAYPTFISEVAAVVDLNPTLRQITFRGGLDDFESLGRDQFLYVLLPPRGRSELTIGADFSWRDFEEMPKAEQPEGAYYTVRRWRQDSKELDMWFVLHGDTGASSAWASQAQPGQRVGLWGPRRSFEPPAGTGSYLFVVDETGFGAAAALLDELLAADASTIVTVVAECDGIHGRVDFLVGAGVDIRWVDRLGRAPGATAVLLDEVRLLDIPADVYAFGAAESRRITTVRRYLRDTLGLAARQVSMTGYWRAAAVRSSSMGEDGLLGDAASEAR